jgi:hypothetical protein
MRAVPGALLLLPFGYMVNSRWGLPAGFRFVVALLVSIALTGLLAFAIRRVWRLCTDSIGANAIPTHNAADRPLSLSHLEALIASGQHDLAGPEVDRLLAEHGVADSGLCQLAVNYYLRADGDAAKAETLLRRMRHARPEIFEHLATHRLIDLLMRDPTTARRAIPELHRLAHIAPDTPEAAGALATIARLRGVGQAEAR